MPTQTFDPGDGGPPYRCGVGIVVFNAEGKVLGCMRAKQKNDLRDEGDPVQWPQGGIDIGEDEETAAYRELYEEIGLQREQVKFLMNAPDYTTYEFSDVMQQKFIENAWDKKLKYRGQRHKWFAFLLTDENHVFSFDHHHEVEFEAVEWMEIDDIPERVIAFKRDAYKAAADMLRPLVAKLRNQA
jgi:putative (di)nucleoside polyphosphate hydrolase